MNMKLEIQENSNIEDEEIYKNKDLILNKLDNIMCNMNGLQNQQRYKKRADQMKKRKDYLENNLEEEHDQLINKEECKPILEQKQNRRQRNRANTSETINFNNILDEYLTENNKNLNIISDTNLPLVKECKNSLLELENNEEQVSPIIIPNKEKSHSKNNLTILSFGNNSINFNTNEFSFANQIESTKEVPQVKALFEDQDKDINHESDSDKELNLSDLDVSTNVKDDISLTPAEQIIKTNSMLFDSIKRGFFQKKNNLISKINQKENNFTASYMMALGLGANDEDESDLISSKQHKFNLSVIQEEDDKSQISNIESNASYFSQKSIEKYNYIRKKSLSCFFINEQASNREYLEDYLNTSKCLHRHSFISY